MLTDCPGSFVVASGRVLDEPDATRQEALWKQAQSIALQDMVVYPIQYANQVYARTSNVDYGHELKSNMQLSPGIDETTRFIK